MKVSAILALLVCAAMSLPATGKPNIVYILADDLGYGDLSCYGQKKLKTPNIDRLATEGLLFTDHYSGSTVCAPSRSVLITGQHTGHTWSRGNRSYKPEGEEPLPPDSVTLPKLLKTAGYATGVFGKWGLGGPESTGQPNKQGVDAFYGFLDQHIAHDFYPRWLWHNEKKIQLDRKVYAQDPIVEEALKFIRANKDNSFFCYMPVTIPHAAMQVPREIHDKHRKNYPQFDKKVGRYGGDARGTSVRNPIAGFAGMMEVLDRDVGRVLDLLAELKIDDNTIVMFTSDNGPHREGGHDPNFWDSNGPLRGIKRDLYEGGIRVPMLARWPAVIKPGRKTGHVSAFWDVLPTACELAGVEIPDGVDGLSFVPTLRGEDDAQKTHKYLYWEFTEQGGRRAARFGQWKAVQYNVSKPKPRPIEIYDLQADLGEKNNLAKEKPGLVAQAESIFKQAHTPSKLFPLLPSERGGKK